MRRQITNLAVGDISYLKAFGCLIIRLTYLGLFSVAYAVIPEVSKRSMAANYNKLWKLLIDRKLKRTDWGDLAERSTTTVAKPGKDEMSFSRSE